MSATPDDDKAKDATGEPDVEARSDPSIELTPHAEWIGLAVYGVAWFVFVATLMFEFWLVGHAPSIHDSLPDLPSSMTLDFTLAVQQAFVSWRTSAILLFGVTCVTAIVSIGGIVSLISRRTLRPLRAILVLGIIAVVVVGFASRSSSTPSLLAQVAASISQRSPVFAEKDLTSVVMFPKRLGEIVAGLLGIAMATVLILPRTIDLEELARRYRRLRVLLYLGAAMLVLGVIVGHRAYGWMFSFFPPTGEGIPDAKSLAEFRNVATGLAGAFYTLVLASIYLPSAYVLNRIAGDLARESLGPVPEAKKSEAWLASRQLSLGWQGQLTRIVALVAPVASSLVTQFLTVS